MGSPTVGLFGGQRCRCSERHGAPHGVVWPGNRGALEYFYRSIRIYSPKGRNIRTKWCMLERKCYDILESLIWHRKRLSRVAFADDDFDATEIIGWTPIALVQELSLKAREIKGLKFPASRQFCVNINIGTISAWK